MQYAYMRDMLLKEYTTHVVSVDGMRIILEDTIFYPLSGGVDHDTGLIEHEQGTFRVVCVVKEGASIIHELAHDDDTHQLPIKPGDEVRLILDWDRRWRLMRMHTTAHLLAAALYARGAQITGNMMTVEKGRMDFNLPMFDRAILEEAVRQVNAWIEEGGSVDAYTLPREEALKQDHLVKLASKLPPAVEELRIIRITRADGMVLDEQADGGCHVPRLEDIGRVDLVKVENKGKGNRRLVFTLHP